MKNLNDDIIKIRCYNKINYNNNLWNKNTTIKLLNFPDK